MAHKAGAFVTLQFEPTQKCAVKELAHLSQSAVASTTMDV